MDVFTAVPDQPTPRRPRLFNNGDRPMTDRVTLEIEDEIAYVTLNRPEKYNGLDMAMFDAIAATAKQLKKTPPCGQSFFRAPARCSVPGWM